MFGQKKQAARTCPNGHPMEETWEQCPYCTSEKFHPKEEPADEATPVAADCGTGAKVVPKKAVAARRLAGWLVAMNGEQEGDDFRVLTGRNVIGKGSTADIVIKDAYLSERHASLEYKPGEGYRLTDLDSKNGSFVNEERVEDFRHLEDGDRLRLANTELRFRSFET